MNVWPENWHAAMVFLAMSRQWHWLVGIGAAVRQGLRYEALPAVLKAVRSGLPRGTVQPYDVLFFQLQQLEEWALEQLAK